VKAITFFTVLFCFLFFDQIHVYSADLYDVKDKALYLQSEERYACEAILCLSTGNPPGECKESLAKYYAIRVLSHGKFSASKTRNARKNFLQQCPTQVVTDKMLDEGIMLIDGKDDAGLDSTMSNMANVVNQCTISYLNTRKIYYAREYSVLNSSWSTWNLLGRNNDDEGSRYTDNPATNMKYVMNLGQFPSCSQRQLNYAGNLAAGQEAAPYRDIEGQLIYPVPIYCYEINEVIDPDAPADCQKLISDKNMNYSNQKYVNGVWVYLGN
jgi:hypothetical protein